MESVIVLHDKMVEHIKAVDFSKVTLEELAGYANIMVMLQNMEKPDITAELLKSLAVLSSTKSENADEGGLGNYGG